MPVDLLERDLVAGQDADAGLPALRFQPIHEQLQALPPGSKCGDPHHPAEAIAALEKRDLLAGGRRNAGALQSSRTAADDEESCSLCGGEGGGSRRRRVGGRIGASRGLQRGSPMQVTMGLRTSRTRQV